MHGELLVPGVQVAASTVWEILRQARIGPAPGSESLSRIMAADLQDTGVTVNLLLPGGVTVTGMLPPDASWLRTVFPRGW